MKPLLRIRLAAALVTIFVLAVQALVSPAAHALGAAHASAWCSGAGTEPDPRSGHDEPCCLAGCSAGAGLAEEPAQGVRAWLPPLRISLAAVDVASADLFPPAAQADPRAPPRFPGLC